MGIFSGVGNFFKPKSEHDKILAKVELMIVKEYRRIGKERGTAPSKKTSDKKIIEIYCRVAGAFKDAAKQRNEKLPEGYINYLAFFFLIYMKIIAAEDQMMNPCLKFNLILK